MINTLINNLYSNKIRPKMKGNLEEPIYVVKEEASGFVSIIKNIHNIILQVILIMASSFIVFISFNINTKIGLISLIMIFLFLSYYRKRIVYIVIKGSSLYMVRKYTNILESAKDKLLIYTKEIINEKCKKYIILMCNLMIIGFFMDFNIIIKICSLLTFVAIIKEFYISLYKIINKKI